MWDYPTEPGIATVSSLLSKVLTSPTVPSFLLGSVPVQALSVRGLPRADVSAWVLGSQMLVTVVNLGYIGSNAQGSINLPAATKSIAMTLWGDGSWVVDRQALSKSEIQGLEVDILLLELDL
jgi:hypothetical protein